nr:hypothetical protein [Oscillospiraceae bacterium]
MDLESTLSTIATQLPEELEQVITYASAYIPEDLSRVIKHASAYIPKSIDLVSAAEFMLYFTAASLILGVLSRIVLGKRSSLNHSLSSAMGILLIYAVTIVVYTFKPWQLELLLSPLPFVTFAGDYLILLPIHDAAFPALCAEILSMVILAFLVNLTDTILPRGNSVFSWYILRFLTVIICMVLHLAAGWAFRTFLPDVLVTYAPTILLGLLIFLVFSGVISLVLGLIITLNSPFLGAMYTFFFSNIIGKQLSKAIFTTTILCAIVYVMGFFGYTVISISAAALMAYIPLALLLMLLWYLIGHVL